ncbi:MAG: GH36-type glycosyl hydrolase domain-containing protein [Spirochaeta sp.]
MGQWIFTNTSGEFSLDAAQRTNGLYFPLANEAGYLASITPVGGGDAKVDQNHFLMPPVSVIDLHNSRLTRTVWLQFGSHQDEVPWSVTGGSHAQKARADEPHRIDAGFLWHRITRLHSRLPIQAEMTSFVPVSGVQAELTRLVVRNHGSEPVAVHPVSVTPMYGRSADSLRDHRHVTSLLNRIETAADGVLLQPTMSFDERGHTLNTTVYAALGYDADGKGPVGTFPDLDAFIGEGGDAERPAVLHDPGYAQSVFCAPGSRTDGCEAVGALQFAGQTIPPGGEIVLYLMNGIFADSASAAAAGKRYCSPAGFDAALQECRGFWDDKLRTVNCSAADASFNSWMRWVSLQPILRRLYGCSFLPYHDYGRGGRGWRDLWQDCLALLLMEPHSVRETLLDNLAGVRFDGTNATIIGNAPGEFIADRNNIPRVWMDHGAWPLMTIQLYVDQTGDFDFLLEEQVYFSDALWARAQERIPLSDDANTVLQDRSGARYQGSVLEHLILQQLSAFFNVGTHNAIRLEGADWNDGLDMADEQGESVAFSGLYAANLLWLAHSIEHIGRNQTAVIEIAEELLILFDRYTETAVDYGNPQAKILRLREYFAAAQEGPSGRTIAMDPRKLAADLRDKADSMVAHIRATEWITGADGNGWFNGYYDNTGARVEGEFEHGVRMTLTGQVFQVLSGVADEQQLDAIIAAADRYLWDSAVGGYRLNTDFREVKLDLGRCFGFAYGHKENGAMFSHMAVMFAFALYSRRKTHAAWRILDTIYQASCSFSAARMYPGIPEYFDPQGRGLYPYLTGSASWYLLTVVTRMFGVRGHSGDLLLDPQLTAGQWGSRTSVSIATFFRNQQITVEYINSGKLDAGEYRVGRVFVNDTPMDFEIRGSAALLSADKLPAESCAVRAELLPLEVLS